MCFAPSKFIGYSSNSFQFHDSKRRQRDGRETNKAVDKIVRADSGVEFHENSELEEKFILFCNSRGVVPDKRVRKFWIPSEYLDQLERFGDHNEGLDIGPSTSTVLDTLKESPEIKYATVRARYRQGRFRRDVLETYGVCAVTGIQHPEMLIASHIIPWCICWKNPEVCLSSQNALLLSAHWDRLFDRGLVTFCDEGKVIVSENLCDEDRHALGVDGVTIELNEGQRKNMKFHRAKIFNKIRCRNP